MGIRRDPGGKRRLPHGRRTIKDDRDSTELAFWLARSIDPERRRLLTISLIHVNTAAAIGAHRTLATHPHQGRVAKWNH
jgi:hypothetical protein